MKEEDRIRLGDIVKDETSGLEGPVEAMTDWLYGCRRIAFRPYGNKDGQPHDLVTFDEMAVQLVKRAATAVPEPEPEPVLAKTGGPQNDRASLRR